MKMFIHSSFGILDCTPMTLQAIENSIPEGQICDKTEDTEVAQNQTEVSTKS